MKTSNTPLQEASARIQEAGWLGRCFGSARNAPINILGLTLVLIFALGAAAMFFGASGMTAVQYWTLVGFVLPIIVSGVVVCGVAIARARTKDDSRFE